jgi:hypothetical protein
MGMPAGGGTWSAQARTCRSEESWPFFCSAGKGTMQGAAKRAHVGPDKTPPMLACLVRWPTVLLPHMELHSRLS